MNPFVKIRKNIFGNNFCALTLFRSSLGHDICQNKITINVFIFWFQGGVLFIISIVSKQSLTFTELLDFAYENRLYKEIFKKKIRYIHLQLANKKLHIFIKLSIYTSFKMDNY